MDFKKILSAAVAAAIGCTCIISVSAAPANNKYSKKLNLRAGQVVTSEIYINVNTPDKDMVSGIEYRLVRDTSALDYTNEVKNATAATLCPNFPKTMISLNPLIDTDTTFFSLMRPDMNGMDLSAKELYAAISFNVKKTGITALDAEVTAAYNNNDTKGEGYDIESILDYADIEQKIKINGYGLGDVTLDNNISVSDAIALQKSIAHISDLNDLQTSLADTNADGEVSVSDAIALQKYIADVTKNL